MWPSQKSFDSAKLKSDGSVEWNGKKVGLWWKDDFRGYHFSPFDEAQGKVWAETKENFRSAVSANNNLYWTKHADP